MKLNSDLARKIVKEARSSIDEHFIIVDTTSRIIASSEPERIGEFHEGAKMAIAEDRVVHIHPKDVAQLKGVKPGINMPIKFNNMVIGVIGITGYPEDVRPFADIIRRLTELFIKEAIHAEQLSARNRGIESYIYEWVHRETIDSSFIERGEILGISIDSSYGLLLCRLEGLAASSQGKREPITSMGNSQLEEQLRAWFVADFNSKEDMMIRWGKDGFLFLIQEPRFQTQRLKKVLEKWHRQLQRSSLFLRAGLSKQCHKRSLKVSFNEAQKALNSTSHNVPITLYEHLRLDILLQELNIDVIQAYLNVTLKPIENDSTLLLTLMTYFAEEMSITQAAEALHVHINTLHYRLNKIAKLTNINLKTTEGIVLAYLALRLSNEQKHQTKM
ncbi:CdaR family transcriptional regulator [Pullulanibacillus pueri]|uniref:Carbohydrate diacid regulator n=1 Tax=Pullulanibacillus pueri TaxID=1437324 RepID=A0A8J2ZU51_9BACL|nr:sugar diacid recognition domain-containing protein [Pullulanibacillus pueri]GGH76280.1 hypothetical protein GCM10007096_06470 [Pullulanibacillus pueri]